jgi:hypothetical protein
MQKIMFLGYVITAQGIEMDVEKKWKEMCNEFVNSAWTIYTIACVYGTLGRYLYGLCFRFT